MKSKRFLAILFVLSVLVPSSFCWLKSATRFTNPFPLPGFPLQFKVIEDIGATTSNSNSNSVGDSVKFLEDIKIREARSCDLSHVASLRVSTFYPELKTVASFHHRILEKIKRRITKGSVCLVAYRNEHNAIAKGNFYFGNVLGTAEFSPSDFTNTTMEHIGSWRKLYVADLAVRGDARRIGLATMLLETIERYAVENDYHEIYLHVNHDNEGGKRLYEKAGYSQIPEEGWAICFTEAHLQQSHSSFIFLGKSLVGKLSLPSAFETDVSSSSSSTPGAHERVLEEV